MATTKYKIVLSEKDETVPKGYIGIYDIFTNDKYALPLCNKEEWCIGEKQLKKMRQETYREVKKRFDICKSADFAKFWNGNLDAINDLGINKFANMLNFKELAPIMICFSPTVQNKTNDINRKIVSFGVKDSLYRTYYRSQLEALRTGEEPKKVKLYDAKKKRAGNIFKQPQVKINFGTPDDRQVLTLERNAVYNQFEHWCRIKGLEKKNGMYQAMLLIMQEYPATGLKEIGAYERKCDLDYSEILIPDVTRDDMVKVSIYLPKAIHKQMSEIIKRFNLDPENIGKTDMSIAKYGLQAIELLNRKSPLKYSDPKFYEEYKKAKEAEAYNKKITETE